MSNLISEDKELIKEWNFEKNKDIDINQITSGSSKKVWWKCKYGHEWEASVVNRVRGRNCPYCSNHKLLKDYNDLMFRFPEIAEEWDYEKNDNLKPDQVLYGSNIKVWWKCKNCGNSWEALIPNRVYHNRGCPYCSHQKILKGYNDLATTNPELASEWLVEKNKLKAEEVMKGTHKKFWWKCKKGHYYESLIYDRINGKGCPICANKKVVRGINDLTTTRPDLLEEWDYEKNNKLGIYPTEVHKGSSKKVWWKCKECGNEWCSLIDSKSRGFSCPECGKKKQGQTLTKKIIEKKGSVLSNYPELVNEWDYEKNYPLKPSDVPPGSNKKVWWKCKNGHEWEAQINQRCNLGTKCAKCLGMSQKSDEDFKIEMKKKNPNIQILSTYENARTRLKCKCMICGNKWEVVANHLQQGQGCPKCATIKNAKAQTMSHEEFVERMFAINENIEIIGEYKTSHKRVRVKCKKCSHIWNPKAWDILQGNGCPNCSHTSTSYIEKFIFESFVYKIGRKNVLSRDRKTIGKELDIYIPNYKFAIEPGSWFWHKNRVKDDFIKIKLCKETGINLVIIYDNYDLNIKPINSENVITYTIDLGDIKNIEKLKELVLHLFKLNDIDINFTKKEWDEISNKAYLSSRQKNTEEFVEELKMSNEKVKVLGEYKGTKNKILVKCNKCNYEWEASPSHLLAGEGCPKCRGFHKTHSEFETQVHKKLPHIKLLTKYINTKTRMDVKCNLCGHIWNVKPGNLLSGYGCPNCSRIRASKLYSKPVYQYTLDGVFIKKYNSGKEASFQTGVSRSGIANACQGKAKSAGGFVWKYKDKK